MKVEFARVGMRVFLSLISSAVIPAILFTALSMTDKGFRGWAFVIVPVVFLTTFLHSFLLGLPVVVLLLRAQKLSWWSLATAGGLIALFPSLIYAALRDHLALVEELGSSTIAM